jgi:HlyD family secretion protein
MKKKILAVCGVVVAAAVCVGIWYQFFRTPSNENISTEDPVMVESIASITGSGIGFATQNRYSGVVESQETLDVKKDDTKTVKNILVTEGQEVEAGTPLFEYDTEELTMKMEQAQIELERIAADIDIANRQIEELTAEKNKPENKDKQLDYTIQIQTQQAAIKESEYSQKSKTLEIEQLQESITNNVVTATITGRVQEINETPSYDSSGNPKPFMQILTIGDYRIKGTVNEQNIRNLSEGQPVIVRSRVDESQTWTGTITKIDMENPVTNQNMYYTPGDSNNQGSSYPFYVELDEKVDLMMGQHVLVETDLGQEKPKEGLWLYDYYIVQDDGAPYVWAADGKDRLEKRPVTLGGHDDDLMQYEILDGLSESDLIAWPAENLTEGMPVTRPGSADPMAQAK